MDQNRIDRIGATIAAIAKQTPTETRELTFGEKAVGLTFNPNGNELVNRIKTDFARVIDGLNNTRATCENTEAWEMLTLAIRDAQAAQMWAVKAVTWQY